MLGGPSFFSLKKAKLLDLIKSVAKVEIYTNRLKNMQESTKITQNKITF